MPSAVASVSPTLAKMPDQETDRTFAKPLAVTTITTVAAATTTTTAEEKEAVPREWNPTSNNNERPQVIQATEGSRRGDVDIHTGQQCTTNRELERLTQPAADSRGMAKPGGEIKRCNAMAKEKERDTLLSRCQRTMMF